jgi:hypothetical protein
MEDIIGGQRVRAYAIEALTGTTWSEIARGTSSGHKKIDRFEPTEVSKLPLRSTQAAATRIIRKLAVYNTTTGTNWPILRRTHHPVRSRTENARSVPAGG